MKELPRNTLISCVLIVVASTLSAQTNADGELKQYLFPAFARGTLKMKDGTTRNLLLNYNTVSEKFVIKQNNDLYDLAETNPVDTILMETKRFVPFNEIFLEVLVDAPVSLYIQNKCNLTEPGSPAGYGSTSKTSSIQSYSSYSTAGKMLNLELPSDLEVTPAQVFWIRQGDDLNSIMSKKQLLKNLPDNNAEIDKFIKDNRLKTNNPEDLIRIIEYYNSFITE